jgi:predicted AAA+ superfamily ATPase
METQIPRFFKVSKKSCFVFGPRGTGKTTFLKKTFPDALWFDLLEPETFRSFSAKPERLSELIAGNGKKTVVIDEIQKLPELLDVIHLDRIKRTEVKKSGRGPSGRKINKAHNVSIYGGRT